MTGAAVGAATVVVATGLELATGAVVAGATVVAAVGLVVAVGAATTGAVDGTAVVAAADLVAVAGAAVAGAAVVVLVVVAATVVPTPYEPHAVSLGEWQLPQFGPLPWLPLALMPLWQVAHVTPVTTACTILQVADEPPLSKLVVLPWQEVQSAVPVGMCPPALV